MPHSFFPANRHHESVWCFLVPHVRDWDLQRIREAVQHDPEWKTVIATIWPSTFSDAERKLDLFLHELDSLKRASYGGQVVSLMDEWGRSSVIVRGRDLLWLKEFLFYTRGKESLFWGEMFTLSQLQIQIRCSKAQGYTNDQILDAVMQELLAPHPNKETTE